MTIPDTLPATLGDPAPTVVPPSERTDMVARACDIVSVFGFLRARTGDAGIVTHVEMLPEEQAVHRAACGFLVREFNRGYRDSHKAPRVATPEPSKVIVP